MRKTSLKIQMLAGNSLNVCPDSDSQKKLPLDKVRMYILFILIRLEVEFEPRIHMSHVCTNKEKSGTTNSNFHAFTIPFFW